MLTLDAARVHEHSDLASLHPIHNSSVRQHQLGGNTSHNVVGEAGVSELLTMDYGGRLDLNLARTTPELPCGRVTLPKMHL